jgi:hypothetical protein
MKSIKTIIISLVFCVSFSTCLLAQSISIGATVDRTSVSMNEQIVLQVTVSGEVSNLPPPRLPPLDEFNVQSAGTSQNIQIINGKMSASLTYNYVLNPKKTGKFTISSVILEHNGQTYKTDPVTIEVGGQGQPQGQPGQGQKSNVQARDKNLFIETSVDKKNVSVNEQITLSVKFYYRINLMSQPEYAPPSTAGFMIEDLPPQKNFSTAVDGVKYNVIEIKTALFPTTAGKFRIGSANLRCTVPEGNNPFGDDFFNQFFSRGKTVNLQSSPIEVTVQNLPSGKPADFTGAVGRYNITASADKTRVKTGDAVTLTVTISGTGNVKTLPAPKIELQNFRKYDTVSSVNVSKPNYVVQGSKSFKTILIPQVPGKQGIPSIKFSYFDPGSNSYKTVQTQPVALDVSQGQAGANAMLPALSSQKQQDIKMGEKDIRHIKPLLAGNFGYNPKGVYATNFLIMLQFIPLFVPLTLWQYRKWKENLYSDKKRVRYTYAYKTAKKQLKTFYDNIHSAETDKIAAGLFDILSAYFGDKFNLSPHGITMEQISAELESKHVDAALKIEAGYIWDEINFIQFAPAKVNKEKVIELYARINELLEKAEKNL